jgi:hypothetical protein
MISRELYVHVTVHRNKFLFNKTNQTHEFPKFYFVKKLYMFRAFPLPIIRSFLLYIRHWYISCRQRKCPKHVEFFDKIKFGKFVCLVGFIKKKDL